METLLAALAFGGPAALFVLWPLLRQGPAGVASGPDDERARLAADKGEALRALRELTLDHQVGHMAEEDYTELRARYEARASGILRRLDALGPAPAPPTVHTLPRTPWSRQPVVLGAAGAGLLVFGVALGVLVTRFAAPAPSGEASTAPAGIAGLGAAPEEPAEPSGSRARPIPTAMLQGMLQAAHASLDAGRYQEAIAAYTAVLKREPTNVDAITHLGVILSTAGHADNALEAFEKALAIDPNYAHALWDKARVLYELKRDYAGAVATWERFARVVPTGADHEQALSRIAEARRQLAAGSGRATP